MHPEHDYANSRVAHLPMRDMLLVMFKIIVGAIALLIIGVGGYFFMSSDTDAPSSDVPTPQAGETTPPTDKVEGQDIVVGTGRTAEPNTLVTIEYIGQLTDGTVFDSSETQGQPLQFVLGAPGIIPGFQIGVNGMKEGGERAIYIPPALAYGDQQVGQIPPNSPLVFRLKLVAVENAPAAPTQ